MFRNIKPGDEVLTRAPLRVGLRLEMFLLPVTVTRTTETQFLVGNARYRKSNGEMVSQYSGHCRPIGKEYKDETGRYEKRKLEVKNSRKIANLLADINKVDFLNHPAQYAVLCLLKQVLKLEQKKG